MANCVLAFPDYVQADPTFATVAFSGGSWSASLPLSNLLKPEFAYVARSVDLNLTSTQFWCDLGVTRGIAGVFVPATNGSLACQYRVRGFAMQDDTTTPVFDSGWEPLYPSIYAPLTLYWGSPSLWNGQLSAEDAVLYPMPVVVMTGGIAAARYWLIEFNDTGNAAGYLQVARVVIAAGWQPPTNMDWTANLVVNDESVVQEALGGAYYFDSRPQRRVQKFSLSYMTDDEAMAMVSDMQRRLGTSGQLFFVHDPDDRTNMHRRSFLARLSTLSPLEYVTWGNNSAPFELTEVVA